MTMIVPDSPPRIQRPKWNEHSNRSLAVDGKNVEDNIPKPWIRGTAWKLFFLFPVSMGALLESRPAKFEENYTTLQDHGPR